MAGRRRLTLVAGAVLAMVAVASACTSSGDEDADGDVVAPTSFPPETTAAAGPSDVERPRGGTVRVGVWAEPDLDAPHVGGAALRALVYPQLFVVGPGGEWVPSLVEPGSDRTAPDRMSASFRLRDGAVWSDGTPITASDLRRNPDPRFVEAVDAATDGTVTVTFTQRYPEWRRLWSFKDNVAPPRDGVWGGPFVLAAFTDGLEAVLHPNGAWWGSGPFVSELRLVLVPNSVIARALLERGELDVLMPPAATARTQQLEAINGVEVGRRMQSGWLTELHLNPERLTAEERAGVVATVDRALFVGTVLKEEALPLHGLAAPEDAAWQAVGPGDPAGLPPEGEAVDLVGMIEEPMTPLLQRSMQRRARPADARLELRNAEVERVILWVAAADFDAAIVHDVDPPQVCWTCRFAGVDEQLARRADAGDAEAAAAVEAHLRDQHLYMPLWRHHAVLAWRSSVQGPAANGYALSPAWNAADWWYDDPNLRQ